MELEYYQNEFKKVQEEKNIRKRNMYLSRLMSQMEFDYRIPGLNDEKYNAKNKDVIDLYREISNARIL